MARDYAAAVSALNSVQTNFAIIDAIRKSGMSRNEQAIPEMIDWIKKIGYEPKDFDKLKPIHIAGTKGKGSTSAFVSSILSQYAGPKHESSRLQNIGLYTSPHLRFVKERIQINSQPLSDEKFAKYFFDVWDRLEAAAKAEGLAPDAPGVKPVYFRYLTLMALHAYMSENVDSAIIECGIGGEYDSTNILAHPTVTAITNLGIDHVGMLGSTIEEIAWHKSGIFKPNAQAYTIQQPESAMEVLQKRASERGVQLHIVQRHPELEHIRLGLSADFQKTNASLAIAVAAAHLRALGNDSVPDPTSASPISLPAEFIRGLEQVQWPGRCETRRQGNITWHIDGGHTLESIELVGQWFAEQVSVASKSSRKRILVFNQQTRDANTLARALYKTLQESLASSVGVGSPFTHAIFCSNVTFASGYKPDLVSVNNNAADVSSLSVQHALADTWAEVDPTTTVKVVRTIEEAISVARDIAYAEEEQVMSLITGSLHLVGGALEVLESEASR